MTEHATSTSRRRPLRFTNKEKEALAEAAYRWGIQMQGYVYDQNPLQSALQKLEESIDY